MKCNSITKAGEATVSPDQLKVCELCGSLNHVRNRECFMCGWHGQFSRNRAILRFAWLRLADQFEEVRVEHVTAKNRLLIEDYGMQSSAGAWRRLRGSIRASWQRLFSGGRGTRMLRDNTMHDYPIT